jgi:serine/threonine protein kinase
MNLSPSRKLVSPLTPGDGSFKQKLSLPKKESTSGDDRRVSTDMNKELNQNSSLKRISDFTTTQSKIAVDSNEDKVEDELNSEDKPAVIEVSMKSIDFSKTGCIIQWSDVFIKESLSNKAVVGIHSSTSGKSTTFPTPRESNSLNPTPRDPAARPSESAVLAPFREGTTAHSTEEDSKVILGKGTFGTVIRAMWKKPTNFVLEYMDFSLSPPTPGGPPSTSTSPDRAGCQPSSVRSHPLVSSAHTVSSPSEMEVAIKILTPTHTTTPISLDNLRYQAYKEVVIMNLARTRMKSTQHIVNFLGVIEGPLPTNITHLLKLPPDEKAVCLVMRYEGGGTLYNYINNKNKDHTLIPMREKMRFLLQIIRGIHDLHSVGIIHADLKPENILISSDVPPQLRLADFGLSSVKDIDQPVSGNVNSTVDRLISYQTDVQKTNPLFLSFIASTKRTQGTMTYCAPEMLVNPYQLTMNVNDLSTVAMPSRRTDIYAFALLTWQILSQRRPFSEVKGEVMLCSHVHQDQRPPLTKLPKDTPQEIISMMTQCWDKDRSKRLTAVECYNIIFKCYSSLTTVRNSAGSISSPLPATSLGTSVSHNISGSIGGGKGFSLVVPLPGFDKLKGSARSSMSSARSSNRVRTDTGDTIDSLQTFTIDYSTAKVRMYSLCPTVCN